MDCARQPGDHVLIESLSVRLAVHPCVFILRSLIRGPSRGVGAEDPDRDRHFLKGIKSAAHFIIVAVAEKIDKEAVLPWMLS